MPKKGIAGIKFGVRSTSGHRSAPWYLFTRDHARARVPKSDIYIQSLALKGDLKTSLHESGYWHTAFTDEAVARRPELGTAFDGGRKIQRWSRPAMKGETATIAFRILISSADVTVPLEPTQWPDVQWHDAPPPGFGVEYSVLIVPSTVTQIKSHNPDGGAVAVVGALRLCNGEQVVLMSRVMMINDLLREELRKAFRVTPRLPVNDSIDYGSPTLRTVLFVDNPDGSRAIMETGWPPGDIAAEA